MQSNIIINRLQVVILFCRYINTILIRKPKVCCTASNVNLTADKGALVAVW